MDILVDSNVLLRMLMASDPHHAAFVTAVDRLLRESNKLFVNAQIISEFWSVATRPKDANGMGMTPATAYHEIEVATGWVALVPEPANLASELLRVARTHDVSGKQVHDARIAAFMNLRRDPCNLDAERVGLPQIWRCGHRSSGSLKVTLVPATPKL